MQKFNVLLIDDEFEKFKLFLEDNVNYMATQNNCEIHFTFKDTITGGKDEVDRHNFYDLIILDLIFRDSTGEVERSFDLLQYIKEYYPDIPVILLSLTNKYEDLKKVGFHSDYKPDGFLSKADVIDKMDYRQLYDTMTGLLKRFGKIKNKYGVLVTHGTDTMSWAFAILRYGLFDLKTNIALTGSQLPLEGTFSPSDAIGNILTSVKILNKLVPPNIIQVFNDGVHIFNKNLNKVKKWSFDAFDGNSFAIIENEQLKTMEEDVFQVTIDNQLDKLYFVKTGGTIDSVRGKEGLEATGDFTDKYISELSREYFKDCETIRINPKDSSLFNPIDWTSTLKEIEKKGLASADVGFNWNILPLIINPFMQKDYYDSMVELIINKYPATIILGYGAGNVNIFGSYKTDNTSNYSKEFAVTYGADQFNKQINYSLVPLLERIEKYNKDYPDDYKFIIMSSQVPIDSYDIDYQAGQIPLYYGAIPSGDLSYPEAQTKLAFILGHMELIQEKAKKNSLTYEQVIKSSFLCGTKFTKQENERTFMRISKKECGCTIYKHPKNLFVKYRFDDALKIIIEKLKTSGYAC